MTLCSNALQKATISLFPQWNDPTKFTVINGTRSPVNLSSRKQNGRKREIIPIFFWQSQCSCGHLLVLVLQLFHFSYQLPSINLTSGLVWCQSTVERRWQHLADGLSLLLFRQMMKTTWYTGKTFRRTHIEGTVLFDTHGAAALVHPDATLLLLCVGGLESQEVLPCTQAIIVTQHTHYQVQRVSVQHILTKVHSKAVYFH